MQSTRGLVYGPTIQPLQAQSWKIQCPPKLRHFLWQVITGCISVTANLRNRGIGCDTQCAQCGLEETINHALFECPPAFQTWALSTTPTAPGVFLVSSRWTNMDFLFWRMPSGLQDNIFPWTLWYIWRARNDKVFRGIDVDPHVVARNAAAEAQAWEKAFLEDTPITTMDIGLSRKTRQFAGLKCYTDGSWKDTDFASGIGWFAFHNEDTVDLMGARNTRRSLSPLHSEVEALVWAMLCMLYNQKTEVAFATDCSDLVKMVSTPKEWPAFAIELEEFQKLKTRFHYFTLSLIPRIRNSRADKLANCARLVDHNVSFVSSKPPDWIIGWW